MANALMLGGGAPTLTLEAGALAALLDKEVKFDAISTAGAGMLVGLLYAAPKGTSPRQALENTREMGVSEAIYDLFPVNFKVFHKPGALADAYRRGLHSLPRLVPGQDPASRLFADWMALVFATWCPSDLSEKSLGLCDHASWIDDVVDFDRLKSFPGEFYMNAYCIEDHKMTIFTKEEITPDHFRAALAFPFIYPPFKFKGKTYLEGSAIDTLCFEGLLKYREDRLQREKAGETETRKLAALEPLRNIVVFDVLSSKKIIREPRSLYDAWIQSIMIPLVEIAKDEQRSPVDEALDQRHQQDLRQEEAEADQGDGRLNHQHVAQHGDQNAALQDRLREGLADEAADPVHLRGHDRDRLAVLVLAGLAAHGAAQTQRGAFAHEPPVQAQQVLEAALQHDGAQVQHAEPDQQFEVLIADRAVDDPPLQLERHHGERKHEHREQA
jgi:NTE family protein